MLTLTSNSVRESARFEFAKVRLVKAEQVSDKSQSIESETTSADEVRLPCCVCFVCCFGHRKVSKERREWLKNRAERRR